MENWAEADGLVFMFPLSFSHFPFNLQLYDSVCIYSFGVNSFLFFGPGQLVAQTGTQPEPTAAGQAAGKCPHFLG